MDGMDKIIKDEFALSKRAKMMWVMALLAFMGLSVFTYLKLYKHTREIVSHHAIESIENISQLNEDAVSRTIENRRAVLEMVAARLSKRKVDDMDTIMRELDDIMKHYDFYSMGVMDENYKVHLTSGHVVDAAGDPIHEMAWDDKFHLSPSFMPEDGGEYAINIFTYPVYSNYERKYILIGGFYSRKLTDRMNINSMGGSGYSFILDEEGSVVVYPKDYKDDDYNGLMSYVNDAPDILPNEEGYQYFEYENEKYYAHYEQLQVNDWYLMTCAKESDVFANANLIIHGVLTVMGFLWLMILLAVCMIVYSMYKSKRDIRKAVFYDELTQLGNDHFLPVYYRKIPEKELPELALTVFDIDKFKEFNYIYGEECGDHLLKYIVKVFKEELPEDWLFRYHDDNFVAVIRCTDRNEFVHKMEKFLKRCGDDIERGAIQPFDISAGVRGIRPGDSFRRVMSDARIARGTIKGIQLQQYAFYDKDLVQKRMSYMEMESDFSRALKAKEFKVYYQPKYDMTTGKIVGAESLVRWVRTDGSIVSPGEFIPCFEASRQIILLDEAMLESVCRQMKEMLEEGLEIKRVSVNLSRVHLRHPGILPKIERIVTSAKIDPEMISFEITESALYEDSIPLNTIVEFLHSLGCRVDMDDYGVGVSSPNSLAANRFDLVKMDKSFIDGIGDERIEAVIKSTISLAKTLGMDILAEGVEEKYQAERLIEWGCTTAQGFYYSRPVPEEEYRRLLKMQSAEK